MTSASYLESNKQHTTSLGAQKKVSFTINDVFITV